ncbi:hypothetical protein BTJ68_14956 [Hortaea werneckii EXF-2000]|uniref:Methylthioribose-1-phosphate isomerase n=1 Tax=Hortaea werneckii EXF-2000 TaxID=1157616 RepID=A0A1Z5SMK5_HORWE|nr:hypothetical protein BTJ68_14956 [Hortaea werneckii EXF-2000]
MVLQAVKYKPGSLEILNQLKLPHQEEYDAVRSAEDGWHAIKEMRTRGAPAIAIVAALSLAVELQNTTFSITLVTSRPTAVNLADAARKLRKIVESAAGAEQSSGDSVAKLIAMPRAQMLISDVSDNEGIGKYGAEWIEKQAGGGKVSVVTHCNTGSLATAGYGTALVSYGRCTRTVPLSMLSAPRQGLTTKVLD